jgi:hypothetical protein
LAPHIQGIQFNANKSIDMYAVILSNSPWV